MDAAIHGRAVFVITNDDTTVHLYRDVQSLVLDTKEGDAARLGSVGFFNVRGQRLAPVLSADGALTGLRNVGGQPDVRAVQARLCTVLRNLAATVEARVAKAAGAITVEEALRLLPELDGKDLQECYDLLEPVFSHAYRDSDPKARDDRDWWHNLWAH
ncbi:MAG TPA: hypothetical protein VFB84_12830 [Micromonosporaceae bacterium]|nr:hypothetical protein [Micromonosporaceae bacterium]